MHFKHPCIEQLHVAVAFVFIGLLFRTTCLLIHGPAKNKPVALFSNFLKNTKLTQNDQMQRMKLLDALPD